MTHTTIVRNTIQYSSKLLEQMFVSFTDLCCFGNVQLVSIKTIIYFIRHNDKHPICYSYNGLQTIATIVHRKTFAKHNMQQSIT